MPRKAPAPRPSRRAGFTLVEIMVVVLIISTLLNVAAPAMISARDRGQARSCVKNLSNIATAKEQWAMDNKIPANYTTAPAWNDLKPYVRATASANGPICPTNGSTYVYGTLPNLPTCPYGASSTTPQAVHSL